ARLTALANEVATVKSRIDSTAGVSETKKAEFATLAQAFDSVRVKFGVAAGRVGGAAPTPGAGGGGGGGGGRFGAANSADVLGRLGQVKSAIANVWETPSEGARRQASEAVAALQAALPEAEDVLVRATTLGRALRAHGLTLGAP
ncbi:MAG TPA: hypothetical protein PKE51_03765, partial [Gemmatimonadaceae bacterium]|nr:hypothetical protein [Gemmatimonadaceae bacterium]